MRRFMLWVVLAGMGVLWAGAVHSQTTTQPAAAPDERPAELHLSSVLWQALPEDVGWVNVEPDGRVWTGGREPLAQVDITQIKHEIESASGEIQPRLRAGIVVRFDSFGRVWTACRIGDGHALLGYDAKSRTWAEHRSTTSWAWFGRIEAAGSVFFCDRVGIYGFDGKNWSLQPIAEAGPNGAAVQTGRAWLTQAVVEPDGKGLAVVALPLSLPDGRVTDPLLLLLYWRDGQWTRVSLGKQGGRQTVPSVAVLADGRIIVAAEKEGCYELRLKPEVQAAAKFASLAAGLDDNEFAVREKATEALVAMGLAAGGPAREALTHNPTAEVRARLEKVLEKLAHPEPKAISIGPYRVRRLAGAYQDARRAVLAVELDEAAADAPAEAQARRGLLVLDDADAGSGPKFLEVSLGAQAWEALAGELVAGRPYRGGEALLISGTPRGPAQVLDLAGRQPALTPLTAADTNFTGVLAASPDGTVFLAGRDVPGPIIALRPGARDDRLLLKSQTIDVGNDKFCVGSDGQVWATSPAHEVIRFDGHTWATLTAAGDDITYLVPGAHGEVVAGGNNEFHAFIFGEHVETSADLADLLRDHRQAIVQAFGGVRQAFYGRKRPSFAVDKAGRIWLLRQGELKVLTGDAWVDVLPDLGVVAKDLAAPQAMPFTYISAVGDGSGVYLSTAVESPGGRAFLGTFEGDKAHFVAVPAQLRTSVYAMARPFRDDTGGLWITSAREGGGFDTVRITEKGAAVLGTRSDDGVWIRGVDRAGYVWLTPGPGDKGSRGWRLRRDGRLCGEVAFPGGNELENYLSTDAPGSVFVWTALGLHHLIRDEKGPAPYRLAATYHPVDEEGMTFAPASTNQYPVVAYSSLGYLVTVSAQPGPEKGTHYRLHLIPLPGDGAATQPAAPKAP